MQKAQAVGRVLWKLGSRHRTVRGGVAAARTVGKATARATRILVLEITGFFFAIFAIMGVAAMWRQWEAVHSGQSSASVAHVVATLLFTAAFVYFSANSFWRARRESRLRERSDGGP